LKNKLKLAIHLRDHCPEGRAQAYYYNADLDLEVYAEGVLKKTTEAPVTLGLGAFEGGLDIIDPHFWAIRSKDEHEYFGTQSGEQSLETGKAHSFQIDLNYEHKEKERYLTSVTQAISEIAAGKYQKIVLARRKKLQALDQKRNLTQPADWITHLFQEDHHGHQFLFQTHEKLFISLSPESLFTFQGGQLRIDAIAGTSARGATPKEDDELYGKLAKSEKEKHEHQIVCDEIEASVKRLDLQGNWIFLQQPLKLKFVQHIYSLYQIDYAPEMSLETMLDLITHFHPTPAVGGHPRELCLETLKRLEAFKRGPYAAPFLIKTPTTALAGVGIRSAEITENEMIVWAGGGVVKGSVPEKEWQETERKCRNFL